MGKCSCPNKYGALRRRKKPPRTILLAQGAARGPGCAARGLVGAEARKYPRLASIRGNLRELYLEWRLTPCGPGARVQRFNRFFLGLESSLGSMAVEKIRGREGRRVHLRLSEVPGAAASIGGADAICKVCPRYFRVL